MQMIYFIGAAIFLVIYVFCTYKLFKELGPVKSRPAILKSSRKDEVNFTMFNESD